jgi:hypothetical protein
MTNFWQWSETFSPPSNCSLYLKVILSAGYAFAYGLLIRGKKAACVWKKYLNRRNELESWDVT